MISLRDYQVQALEAERKHRETEPAETRLAIVLPTGTGKSITLAERARRFIQDNRGAAYRSVLMDTVARDERGAMLPDYRRALILVHTDELVSQLESAVRLVTRDGWTVGVVKADRDETDADIIVGSVQTLARPERRARITDVGLVIVDEAHHAAATSYQEILQHFGCMEDPCDECGERVGYTPALGFTATLERGDGAGLGGVWQNVAFTRDISWAVRKGYLVQPIGYRLEIDVRDMIDVTPVDRPGPEYMPGGAGVMASGVDKLDRQLMDSMAPEKIVEKWQELAKDRKTIAFMPLVRSARALEAEFLAIDVKAAVVHGDMPPAMRRSVINAFRRGDIQVLCNAMVLTEGFDDPATSCVIVGRPTKSRSLFIQMAGRGLRPVPGIPVEDQDCILISLADATTDLCSIADLSDRLTDRKADGPLTAMEDEFDIGRGIEDAARHWTGKVDATRFDPIVAARSKVWTRTKGGHWFLPISKDREYVFLMDSPDGNTDIYVLTRGDGTRGVRVQRLHTVGDQELAFSLAEDEAAERGGDVGALLADRTRAWRKAKPAWTDKMIQYALRLGLESEVNRIMDAPAGGKAGKVSDLIRRVEASRSIDKAVVRIKERQSLAVQ
jgi:superfamily II DNA or RNA helicase